MYNVGIGILLALLAIIPCVNLVIAFMVNQRVNRYLQGQRLRGRSLRGEGALNPPG